MICGLSTWPVSHSSVDPSHGRLSDRDLEGHGVIRLFVEGASGLQSRALSFAEAILPFPSSRVVLPPVCVPLMSAAPFCLAGGGAGAVLLEQRVHHEPDQRQRGQDPAHHVPVPVPQLQDPLEQVSARRPPFFYPFLINLFVFFLVQVAFIF